MKARELVDLDGDELVAKLAEAKDELFKLRFQNVTGQLENGHRLGEVRKDIARILTAIRQRELAGEAVPTAEKTVVVEVEDLRQHRLYGKTIRRTTKLKAHDEQNAKVGDLVRVFETRPLSAAKRWRVAEIVQRAE